ncbi:MAG: outer membrane protein transport protein [Xanthomonadaceae bacterium]|nr:outer membrane protein transport protein [Xanthomonadaceae bacterium]
MQRRIAVFIGALMLCCGTASATDGYFSHGYGMKAKGRGGASAAVVADAFGGANNPATMVMAGNQLDVGLDAFNPERSAERSGLGPGLDGSVDSGRSYFAIPEFAYNRMLRDNLALGVTVYGNGGMNTDYPGGQFNCGQGAANMLCGSGALGVDLTQLIVAPTLSYAITPNQSIGIAPLLTFQRFSAKGLQAFAGIPGLSAQPDKVSNNGHDDSRGVGVRVGYYARISPAFAVGAAYAGKTHMSRFSEYAGLFAGRGSFDIPENYSLGVAWTPSAPLTVALDYQRINYGDVASVGQHSLVPAQLGADNGPGFGWKNINVWKLGLEYASSERWTWRAGFNHCDEPIGSADVTFNILAPGVVTNHLTLGFTYTTRAGGEWTVAYMHAFERSVQGASILPVFMGGAPAGNERISMHENSLGIAYAWKL